MREKFRDREREGGNTQLLNCPDITDSCQDGRCGADTGDRQVTLNPPLCAPSLG